MDKELNAEIRSKLQAPLTALEGLKEVAPKKGDRV